MELVRLALEEEGSIAALARKHDVNDNLLFKWIRLWQREGRVCRPRKNSSSLPALIVILSATLNRDSLTRLQSTLHISSSGKKFTSSDSLK
ncbi:transposase [Escherichia coli]